MEASKVTISKELLWSPLLTKKKKYQLKTGAVKELIRSKPAGHKMNMTRLMIAAGYDITRQYQSGYGFIKGLMEKKIIVKDQPKEIMSSWSIPGDVVVKTPAKPENLGSGTVASEQRHIPLEITPKIEPIKNEGFKAIGVDPAKSNVLFPTTEIIARAKQFAWERNSDSLRDFIASLQ